MQSALLNGRKAVSRPKFRPPKKNIPQTKSERDWLLRVVRAYLAGKGFVPPLPLDQLRTHAGRVLALSNANAIYRDYAVVLVNNEVWRESLAAVPYERRLLMLPKCLREEGKCTAPVDEFGLLCKQCGLCSIHDLQTEGERLGYAVLVAEGSAVVTSLIQTGKIDAIVGISCMSVLEKAFPYMEAAAIPGMAIPLLQDDCHNTAVDLDWVWDIVHLTSDDRTHRLDLSGLRAEVESWFATDALEHIMGPAHSETEHHARSWLMRAGKRWRPFLTVAAFQAMRQAPEAELPAGLRKIAVAVECFHKASLIHDDIEDGDQVRYGEKTLHVELGIPVALNIGDMLIGEGYRMIAASDATAEQKTEMLWAAAQGQRKLCAGQGAELAWARDPKPLSSLQVLDIFRQKTAPAFEVSLLLGAIYAGGHEQVADVISPYSEALGIAYQIRDDLGDLKPDSEANDLSAMRPSLLLALAHERATGYKRAMLEDYWRRRSGNDCSILQWENLCRELRADDRARQLLETYKDEAIIALEPLADASLKGLLRRVIGKIFNPPEVKGWCHEFEVRNAASRAAIAEITG